MMRYITKFVFLIGAVCLSVLIYLQLLLLPKDLNEYFPAYKPPYKRRLMYNQFEDVPSLELALQMNGNPVFVYLYKAWFTRSLKLFWPEEQLILTLVLDDENEDDHKIADSLKNTWPWPKIEYLKPGNSSVYKNQRERMYLSNFLSGGVCDSRLCWFCRCRHHVYNGSYTADAVRQWSANHSS